MLRIKHDKNILSEDIIDGGPSKTNGTGAKDSFLQETLFQISAYENNFIKPISFSVHNQHYGKINNQLMSLLPSEDYLVPVSNEPSIEVLDFVARAYFAFLEDLQSYKISNKILSSSKVYNFKAKGEQTSFDLSYDSFVSDQYSYFLEYVNTNKTKQKIFDLDSFLHEFVNYVDSRTIVTPFIASSFLSSRRTLRDVTGLVVNLDEGDPNDDKNKYDNFIQDESFECFQDLALSHGFVVNKDIPWQIVADLESVNMKFYFHVTMLDANRESPIYSNSRNFNQCKDALENFNLTDWIFDPNNSLKYFKIINYNDLEKLKFLIYRFYNSFVQYEPKITITKYEKKLNQNLIKHITKNRQFLFLKDFEEISLSNKLMRLYIYLKARESNQAWSQSRFESIVRKAQGYQKALDTEKAIRYVQSEVNQVKVTKVKQQSFYF